MIERYGLMLGMAIGCVKQERKLEAIHGIDSCWLAGVSRGFRRHLAFLVSFIARKVKDPVTATSKLTVAFD